MESGITCDVLLIMPSSCKPGPVILVILITTGKMEELTSSVPRKAAGVDCIAQPRLNGFVISLGCFWLDFERLDATLDDWFDHPKCVLDLGFFGKDD